MAPPQSPDPREWLGYDDDDGTTWLFDVTFLASNWSCIFGCGCKGVLTEDTTELGQGCCSYGAHFADEADLERVRFVAETLDSSTWVHRDATLEAGGAFVEDDGATTTRIVDDACCFLNPASPGDPGGCALHLAALERSERPMDLKPEVCWQVPLRLVTTVDESGRDTYTLREWRRADWGDAGDDFAWWCTDSPDAFVGSRRVVDSLADEIRELIGDERYDWLLAEMDRPREPVWLPHPRVRRT